MAMTLLNGALQMYFLFLLLIVTPIHPFTISSASPLRRTVLKCSDDVEALKAAAAKLRDEAESIEKTLGPRKAAETSPVAVEYADMAGSRWRIKMEVNYEGFGFSTPLDVLFLEDGYSEMSSPSKLIMKVWGWDVEADDGTNEALENGGDLDVLLFSADVDPGSFSLLPPAIATEFQKSSGPGRVYFTAVLSTTDGILKFLKGTLTVKIARSPGGGWWGGDGILADFKVIGGFGMSSI